MTQLIDITKSKYFKLPFLNDDDAKRIASGKGWSFSFVYHFIELKNIYIALKKYKFENLEKFSNNLVKLPYVRTPWESRRILEQLNGLINFGLISSDYIPINNFFEEDEYSNDINQKDLFLFNKIYHNYFRFKEIHSWLLDPKHNDHISFLDNFNENDLKNNSKPIFPFFLENRFYDAFIDKLENNTDVYYLSSEKEKKNGGIIRFWDVYLKWGIALNLIEKFNLENLDIKISKNVKSFSGYYYINDQKPSINLLEFIKDEYNGKYIHIPRLVLKIALKYRYRIKDIKEMIIEQALLNSDKISLQRTSEIFIRDTEINFVPQYRNSYISHLQIQ